MLPKTRTARLVASLSIALSLALLAAVGWRLGSREDGGPAPGQTQAAIGGPFTLTDTAGERVSARDFRGRYRLIYFGYTHCPDVCPATLNAMTRALNHVRETAPAKAAKVVPIFITLDPARDDVARMKAYAANFHPRLVALTGSRAGIERAAEAYRVAYETLSPEEAADSAHRDHDGYLIRHSSYVFLIGPQGRHRDHLPPDAGATRIAEMLLSQVAG